MRLEGRIALITGAASGIGRATAIRFANEGARVIINDVNREAVEATVAAMGAARERACAHQADVSDSAAVRAMFAEVNRRFGGLENFSTLAGFSLPLRGLTANLPTGCGSGARARSRTLFVARTQSH